MGYLLQVSCKSLTAMSLPSQEALPNWLRPFTSFLWWWPRVNRQTTRADLMAGLTGALVALPQGVAFATIAGMPPEYGLYAGMIPAIIAALFGSSWHLVSGPTRRARCRVRDRKHPPSCRTCRNCEASEDSRQSREVSACNRQGAALP